MSEFLKLLAIVVLAVVLALVIKPHSPNLALCLGLLVLVILCTYVFEMLTPIFTVISRLEDMTGLDNEVLAPVLKTALVGILTNMTATVCQSGGQAQLGKLVEVCGTVLALYLATPLVGAVLDLLTTMLGG